MQQEQEWLRRARLLDDDALTMIFDTYYPLIYRYLFHRLGHRQTAEDLAAQVFHRLLQHLHAGQGPDHNLKGWLFQVAANLMVDDLRREHFRAHDDLSEQLHSDDLHTEELTERALIAAETQAAIGRLAPRQRDVIILRYLLGFDLNEIAEILEVPLGSIKALQHRGLTALRRQLVHRSSEGQS